MKRRCVRGPFPGQPNYFEDTTECTSDGKHWTLAVQAESDFGQTCSGVNGQSLPINSTRSPVSFEYRRGTAGWTGHIATDLVGRAHPCGSGRFTWVAFMDHVSHGGGPLPQPHTLETSVVVNFASSEPNGNARFIVGWQGYWDNKSFGIEIQYYQSEDWGDNHPAEDIVTVEHLDEGKPTANDFVALDARHMVFAHAIQRSVTQTITTDWSAIVLDLVKRGIIAAPSGGFEQATTTAIYVGAETHNLTPTRSVSIDLWFADFVAREKASAEPGSTPSAAVIATGPFRVGATQYYSNGQDAYCAFDDLDEWKCQTGLSDPQSVRAFARVPSGMRYDGLCAIKPSCESSGSGTGAIYSEGLFRVGATQYYSNGTTAYCAFDNLERWQCHTGLTDTTTVRAFSSTPYGMAFHGACAYREGC